MVRPLVPIGLGLSAQVVSVRTDSFQFGNQSCTALTMFAPREAILFQAGILRLGRRQDRDVLIGFFPEHEYPPVSASALVLVSAESEGTRLSPPNQRLAASVPRLALDSTSARQ
jgi:hypothetical protein